MYNIVFYSGCHFKSARGRQSVRNDILCKTFSFCHCNRSVLVEWRYKCRELRKKEKKTNINTGACKTTCSNTERKCVEVHLRTSASQRPDIPIQIWDHWVYFYVFLVECLHAVLLWVMSQCYLWPPHEI